MRERWTAVANEVLWRGNNIDRHICTVHGIPKVADFQARLIAMAPELLDAVKKAFDYLCAADPEATFNRKVLKEEFLIKPKRKPHEAPRVH